MSGIAVLALLVTAGFTQSSEPAMATLAKTPPMGWNSWNKFACDVSEKLIR